jgi:hypothetical protein
VNQRLYEVKIDNLDEKVAISSEQLEYETRKESDSNAVLPTSDAVSSSTPPLKIVNQSGISGLAAELRLELESLGYQVSELTNDLERTEANTVIVYAPEYAEVALELSAHTYGALLSVYEEASGSKTPIVIYVGKDLESAVE